MTTNYTPTGAPLAETRGFSAAIRNEFILVSTAVNSKADYAGQTYSGTHDYTAGTVKVPTLPYGTSGNFAVSWDALNAAIFASASLPAQGGSAGKFLTTNGTTPSWSLLTLARSNRTANAILGAADCSSLIDITSGTFTQTFAAAATLGAGWHCWVRNNGTGDITLDPNASEAIDGLTSYVMYPNEVRLIQCDGTAFRSLVIQGFVREWQASGTFTKPPGYQSFEADIVSAGSSGSVSMGGGGGGRYKGTIYSASLSSSTSVTIGAGGVWTTGNIVVAGGDSSFGPITVKGAISTSPGTAAGAGGGLMISAAGAGIAWEGANPAGGAGVSGVWGGGGGGYNTGTAVNNRGGGSQFAAGGGGGNGFGAPQAGGASGVYVVGTGGAANGSGVGSNGAAATSWEICGAGGGAGSTIGGNGGFPGGGGGAGSTGGGSGANGVIRLKGIV